MLIDPHDIFEEVNATGQHSSFTRKLEENEYFIPAIYALQGLLLSALPLLPAMDKPFSFTRNLWHTGAPWSDNFFYLPMAAGLILIAGSFLRNSERGASGVLALQGTLAGFWFGIFTLFALGETFVYRKSPAQPFSSEGFAAGAIDAVLLALFFSPLIFTFLFALKDLGQLENGAAIILRLMAGCCEIALLRVFRWPETGRSVGGSLFLICFCLVYGLTAFHARSINLYAARAGVTSSLLAVLFTGFLLVIPDFSGFSVFTRQRSDLLLILLVNAGLALASAMALTSYSSRQRIPA